MLNEAQIANVYQNQPVTSQQQAFINQPIQFQKIPQNQVYLNQPLQNQAWNTQPL